jgi:hypothetical protein
MLSNLGFFNFFLNGFVYIFGACTIKLLMVVIIAVL